MKMLAIISLLWQNHSTDVVRFYYYACLLSEDRTELQLLQTIFANEGEVLCVSWENSYFLRHCF